MHDTGKNHPYNGNKRKHTSNAMVISFAAKESRFAGAWYRHKGADKNILCNRTLQYRKPYGSVQSHDQMPDMSILRFIDFNTLFNGST